MLKTLEERNLSKAQYINKKCESLQHEDNFYLLKLLLPNKFIENQKFKSQLKNKPELILTINKCFKYTVELNLQYQFKDSTSETVIIRSYQDAKVAELMYCTDFQIFIRLMGPKIPVKTHFNTRISLNRFLNKWLNFLTINGYSSRQWVSFEN